LRRQNTNQNGENREEDSEAGRDEHQDGRRDHKPNYIAAHLEIFVIGRDTRSVTPICET